MDSKNGYIKLDRKILNWEWYKNPKTKVVFLHCLLKANWKDAKFEGIDVPGGSFVTSLSTLSEELQLSVKEIRTALKHLNETGELASKSYAKYRIITVLNYSQYQDVGKVEGKQGASKGQAKGKQGATIEEYKESKKEINNINICASETVPEPTAGEAESLFEELWKAYPQKRGKGSISITAKKKLLKIGREHMLKAIERYVEECKTCGRYYKNGSTFFNSGYIDYLDENFKPLTAQPDKNTKRNAMINHSRDSVNYDELVAQQLFFKDFEGDAETGGHD